MKSYKITIVITSLIIGFFLVSIGSKDAFSQGLEWVAESSMLTARDSFTGGVIGGKIYVFGGNGDPNGFNLKSTEMFDPVTHSWTFKASNENNAGQGVEELTGAVFNDKLYVFGAWGGGTPYGVFNFVQEYDPATDTWTSKAPKPTVVSGAAAAIYNGEIFLFGGMYSNETTTRVYYDVVEAYNPISNTWRTVTNMPYNLGNFSLSIIGTKAYIIGGYDRDTISLLQNVIAYDFVSNQWITEGLGTLPTPRLLFFSSSAPIVDGKIYLIGGQGSNVGWDVTNESDISITNEVLVYDPSTTSFSSGPSLPQALDGFLAVTSNNSIYVIGGRTDWESDSRTNAVWRLDLASKPNIIPIISLLLDNEDASKDFTGTYNFSEQFDNNISNGVTLDLSSVALEVTKTNTNTINLNGTVTNPEETYSYQLPLVVKDNTATLLAHPYPIPGGSGNLLEFLLLSDGNNMVYTGIGQEQDNLADISLGVGHWLRTPTPVTIDDFVGTWSGIIYSDPNLRNTTDGFNVSQNSGSISKVNADTISVIIDNVPLLLEVTNNRATLADTPVTIDSAVYHAISITTDGSGLSLYMIVTELSDPTDVSVGISLMKKQ